MGKIGPFRDEVFKSGDDLRVRLNELVSVVNDTATGVRHYRLANVQAGVQVVLPSVPFVVGAVLVASATPTNGGSGLTSAPWAKDVVRLGDGRISMTVGGLSGSSLYSVDIVLVQMGSTI